MGNVDSLTAPSYNETDALIDHRYYREMAPIKEGMYQCSADQARDMCECHAVFV